MTDKIYKLMNWPKIEEIVYSESSDPFPILGPHKSGMSRLVQCFFPGANKVIISWGAKSMDKSAEMELADESGFFAALIPGSEKVSYRYNVFYNDRVVSQDDPYRFGPVFTEKQINKINSENEFHLDKYLGARKMEINNTPGVYFAVFAPNAMRVSVVADFNNFDGRVHQMRKVPNSAFFEIFIPGEFDEFTYAFELKEKGYKVFVKADPFAKHMTPDGKCVFKNEEDYVFSDEEYIRTSNRNAMIRNCKISLRDFADIYLKNPEATYLDLAKGLGEFVAQYGYTHIEIQDAFAMIPDSQDINGYFSVNTEFGSINDFKRMIDLLHIAGINVILAVNYAYFSKDSYMSYYEGEALFEHPDERIAIAFDGNHNFNYERYEVLEFFVSHLFYISDELRCDGVKFKNISRMVYMDYGKKEGQFVRNNLGGTMNLESASAIRLANGLMKDYRDDFLIIADIDGDIPLLTDYAIDEGGYAFDYKESKGFNEDVRSYFKKYKDSNDLSDFYTSFVYAYAENFILSADAKLHRDICTSKSAQNFRLAVSYLYMYPGQKSMYFDRIMMSDENRNMVSDLNKIISDNIKIFNNDYDASSFVWMNIVDADKNCITFYRRALDDSQILFCVINFSATEKNQSVKVPYDGRYKEIYSSENVAYGGAGAKNIRIRQAQFSEKDDSYTVNIKMPAESMSIFKYTPCENDQ